MNYVLIGDPDHERFVRLRELIENEFQVEVAHAGSFEELERFYKSHIRELQLVLITGGLPLNPQAGVFDIDYYFDKLFQFMRETACIATIGYLYQGPPPTFRGPVRPQLSLLLPSNAAARPFLEMLGGSLSSHLPRVTLDDDSVLREQVRSLGTNRLLEDGKRKLAHLIGGFFTEDAVVLRLRAGLSGARVFRIRLSTANASRYCILKLGQTGWKVKEEARRHAQVKAGIPGYKNHLPAMKPPNGRSNTDGFVVDYGGWYAICYDFLGGPDFEPILDLEACLAARPPKLLKEISADTKIPLNSTAPDAVSEFRYKALDRLLTWLKDEWCMKPGLVKREARKPWIPGDSPERTYIPFPPYRLSGSTKGSILDFLDSSAAEVGQRLMPGWGGASGTVRRFVDQAGKAYATAGLNEKLSFILSPAHGDLNANNVLLCLKLQDPIFLIDFPMFQDQGHALQDFARLETEIKFALMDRQRETPVDKLPAFDSTPTQFGLWCELEGHLLSTKWRDAKSWSESGFRNNINLSLTLVQRVRKAAFEVQRQYCRAKNVPTFDQEYRHPLLYHTLRSITYSSLPVFKRLLAVFSAAKLLEKAGYK